MIEIPFIFAKFIGSPDFVQKVIMGGTILLFVGTPVGTFKKILIPLHRNQNKILSVDGFLYLHISSLLIKVAKYYAH